MDVEIIFKIAGLGVLLAILCKILEQMGQPDKAMAAGLAGTILVLLMVAKMINDLFTTVKTMFFMY